jgi:membrane associated rhomboid family serine protease
MATYRQSPFSNLTPVVKNLLIINVIFFIATIILGDKLNLVLWLSAFYFNSPLSHPWQIITYMFMHGGFMHIGFNMLALFFLGPMLEYTMGSKRFLQYYFITGVGALLIQWVVQAIEVHSMIGTFTIPHGDYTQFQGYAFFDKLEGVYLSPVLGASGAIFGLAVALAMLYPNVELFVMFIPVPIKAKYAVGGYVLLELFSGVGQFSNDHVAHFAHLGGALFGFIMIKIWRMQRPNNNIF